MKRIVTVLVATAAIATLSIAPAQANPRARTGQLLRQIDRRARVQHAMTPVWAVGTHLKITYNAWQQKQMLKRRSQVSRMQRRNVRRRPTARRRNTTTVTTVTTTYRNNGRTRNSYGTPTAGGAVYSNRNITPSIRLRSW